MVLHKNLAAAHRHDPKDHTHLEVDVTDLQDYLTEADADLLYSVLAHDHVVADITDFDPTDYLPLAGGTLTGDVSSDSDILFDFGAGIKGEVEAGGLWHFILRISMGDRLTLGNSSFDLRLEGSETRPMYEGADLALFSDLAAYSLPLTGGTLTGNLYVETSSSPAVFLRPAGSTTSYTHMTDSTGATYFIKVAASGPAIINIDSKPTDGTSEAMIRMNRTTNTSGVSGVAVYEGDGTSSIQHGLYGGSGDAELCKLGGKLTVGGPVQLPYLGAAPSGLTNGMIWMESDGLHLYYAGAEKVVAGA